MDGELAPFTPHDLRRTGATIARAARLPVDFVKALLTHNDKGVTGIYARWHIRREARGGHSHRSCASEATFEVPMTVELWVRQFESIFDQRRKHM